MEVKTYETKIGKWRGSMGLTISKAAQFLGISKSYMSMLESGERKPSRDKAIDIEEKTDGQVSYKDWQ